MSFEINTIKRNFLSRVFNNEDDIKIYTYSDLILPIQKQFAPMTVFHSEYTFAKGGRADGTVENIVFEYKKKNYFNKQAGINEALFGRNENDSGLYEYIINSIKGNIIDDSILDTFGVGFDGNQWIIARFSKQSILKPLNISKTRFANLYGKNTIQTNYEFIYRVFNFDSGLKYLITLFNSTEKIRITKENLASVFNPKNERVSSAINNIYNIILNQTKISVPQRTTTLFKEWDNTFGAMFGNEEQETEFNETSDSIKQLYGVESNEIIDSKLFLFATQTYFNIILKLLIDLFIKSLSSPTSIANLKPSWSEITELFEGKETVDSQFISNFFEIHYYEWFTYLFDKSEQLTMVKIIEDSLEMVNSFDLATYRLRPESVQDVLQEIYMTLIPDKVRHLLGEYFSPDWIVEHALNRIGYFGNNSKKIIDPCCGSGAFIIQALKRAIASNQNQLTIEQAQTITNNIVGFDLNPISAVSAKANYILTLLSSMSEEAFTSNTPLLIPIFIADSVLSPIVYSEESLDTFTAKTTVGNFVIPKFDSFSQASSFLDEISKSIDNSRSYKVFENLVKKEMNLTDNQMKLIQDMYEQLNVLHRSAQDSFWGRILKNSFAPVMLKQRFDYVVGNPPWIAWKSMSKVYREGTLDVWKSYGIFEKNAYDKKTTHDDFGMAVVYVSLDQYLKDNGKLYFLLPWTFFKSSKGGEGFRKLEITRNNQKIPVSVELIDDFNDIHIFKPKHTVRTIGALFEKNKTMVYPMDKWYEWSYVKKKNFEAHSDWAEVSQYIKSIQLSAKPIDSSDKQSSWLTLPKEELVLADRVLLNGSKPQYKGRKGIEPAGAKGVYILKKPQKASNGLLAIVNDMSRQRRPDLKEQGEQTGLVESTFIYPMLGGRNIQRWKVVSNEFMIVPHKIDTPYGLSEEILSEEAPNTYKWLEFYKDGLLASRIQCGKFFNPKTQPWYRLDNVGEYTFSPYKVLWKEQASSFSAVAIGKYSSLPHYDEQLFDGIDKPVVIDSKVLMLDTSTMEEAYYVAGILNSTTVRDIIDAYSVGLNRGTEVLDNILVPKYSKTNTLHSQISALSCQIHELAKEGKSTSKKEKELDALVIQLFEN